MVYAGRDSWARKFVAAKNELIPPTIAENFGNHGITLIPATTDRVQGANQVRMYLRYEERKNEDGKIYQVGPRLRIFESCDITFDCLMRMTHDPNNVEDVLKVDSRDGDPYSGDDPYDAVRYGLMSRPLISLTPKKEIWDPYKHKTSSATSWMTV